jgi:multifunctional 2-oxoglutarate metabolism enzyme
MALYLTAELPVPFYRVSRPESAAPSVGSAAVHAEEAKALLQQAFS